MSGTMTDETTLPPPPPPPGNDGDPRIPWYRVPVSRDPDGVLGGVVAGIARAYGFDVRTTRVAVVILTLVLPVMVFAYVAAWILLPASPSEATGLEQLAHDRSRLPLYIALGAVAVLVGIGSIGSWVWFGSFPWPLALIAIGVLLWAAPTLRSGRDTATPAGGSGGSGTTTTGTASFAPPVAGSPTGGTTAGTPTASTSATAAMAPGSAGTTTMSTGQPVAARRPGIPIGGSVALFALLALAIAISGQAAGWWSVSILAVMIVGLVAISVAGIVSALVNRRWYLLLPVVPLVFAATVLSIARPNFDGGVGDRTRTPVAADVVDGVISERLAVGQLTIDLRELDLVEFTGEPVVVDARVGMGQMRIIVPDDVTFVLDASFGAGQLEVAGRELTSGFRQSELRTYAIDDPAGEVLLELHVGVGQIDVEVRSPRR